MMKELILLFQNFEILLKHGGSLSPLEGDKRIWEELPGGMHSFFVPYNYRRSLYEKLKNFFQRSSLVQECIKSFYQLLCKLSCMGIKIF